MKGKKVKCKIETSSGGRLYEWVEGVIVKSFPKFHLVDLGPFKECFLKVDQGDTWEVVK